MNVRSNSGFSTGDFMVPYSRVVNAFLEFCSKAQMIKSIDKIMGCIHFMFANFDVDLINSKLNSILIQLVSRLKRSPDLIVKLIARVFITFPTFHPSPIKTIPLQ